MKPVRNMAPNIWIAHLMWNIRKNTWLSTMLLTKFFTDNN